MYSRYGSKERLYEGGTRGRLMVQYRANVFAVFSSMRCISQALRSSVLESTTLHISHNFFIAVVDYISRCEI
jgi:hypothetical protein